MSALTVHRWSLASAAGGVRTLGTPQPALWAVRSVRVAALLVAVCLVHAVDLALTLNAHRTGLFGEMNPLANWALGHGPIAAILFKAALVIPATALIWRLRARRIAEAGAWISAVACLALAFCWCDYHRQMPPDVRVVRRLAADGSATRDATIVYAFPAARS